MSTPGWYPDPLGGPGARYWNGDRWEDAPVVELAQELPPDKPQRSRFLVPGLIAAVVALTGVVLVLAWPKSSEAPVPTTALSAPTPTTSATPAVSASEIAAANVRVSMQQKLDSDPDLKDQGLKVVDVVLVNKTGNEFKGIATIRTRDGEKHEVPVEVTADGDNTLWETPPGAFSFVKEQNPPPPGPPTAAPSGPGPVEDFEICPSGLSGVASDETSCAFADNVRMAWYTQPGAVVMAFSPVTNLIYRMECTPATTTVWQNAKRCLGHNPLGATLVVYFE